MAADAAECGGYGVMEALKARAKAGGERRARAVAARLAERLGALPGVRAEAGDGRVTIAGRGLWRRIGWIAGWLK